jgi:hypothetical protein
MKQALKHINMAENTIAQRRFVHTFNVEFVSGLVFITVMCHRHNLQKGLLFNLKVLKGRTE